MNLRGEVVGINTAINPQANTIGFAVPINLAKTILPQLESSGRVSRGYLGVEIMKVSDDFQDLLELDADEGALVNNVVPGSPADEAACGATTVIVEFNGEKVETMEELPKLVAATPVGSKAEVVVLRDGKRKTLKVELADLESDVEVASAETDDEEQASYGLGVQRLTPDLADRGSASTRTPVVSWFLRSNRRAPRMKPACAAAT